MVTVAVPLLVLRHLQQWDIQCELITGGGPYLMNMMTRIIEMATTTAVTITPATAGPVADDDEPSLAIGETERDVNDHSIFSSPYP